MMSFAHWYFLHHSSVYVVEKSWQTNRKAFEKLNENRCALLYRIHHVLSLILDFVYIFLLSHIFLCLFSFLIFAFSFVGDQILRYVDYVSVSANIKNDVMFNKITFCHCPAHLSLAFPTPPLTSSDVGLWIIFFIFQAPGRAVKQNKLICDFTQNCGF